MSKQSGTLADDPFSGRQPTSHERLTGLPWDASYHNGPAPWDVGQAQPAIVRLASAGGFAGAVLDVGCGTGEHALMAAGLGLDATGVDAAATAIELATRKAAERNVRARFLVWDALDLTSLGEQFDTVIDSGLFHIFEDDDRARYVESLGRAMQSGGRYCMLCFSDRQPGDWGPRRVTQGEIRANFAEGWRVESIDEVTMDVNISPDGVRAWISTITRV